jgi:hypothetical protein
MIVDRNSEERVGGAKPSVTPRWESLMQPIVTVMFVGIVLISSGAESAAFYQLPPHLPIDGLLVSNQGRIKPLATLAEEQEILLGVSFPGNPVDGFVALALAPETWRDHVLLELDPPLGRMIGLTTDEGIALSQLVEREESLERIASSVGPLQTAADELLAIVHHLERVEDMITLSPGIDPDHDWVSPNLEDAPPWARESWRTLRMLFQRDAWDEASRAAKALVREQRQQLGDQLPSRFHVALELFWRRVNPPCILPWVAAFALLLHLLGTKRSAGFGRVGTIFLTVIQAVFLSAWIIVAGRLPLLNSWEVHFLVLLLVPLFGLFVEWRIGMALIGTVAVSLTLLGAVGLNFLPAVGSIIRPPVAILQSSWREVHILSTMTSYALLFLVTGLSALLVWKPGDQRIRRLTYRALLSGEVLLGVGIATGAAWAY